MADLISSRTMCSDSYTLPIKARKSDKEGRALSVDWRFDRALATERKGSDQQEDEENMPRRGRVQSYIKTMFHGIQKRLSHRSTGFECCARAEWHQRIDAWQADGNAMGSEQAAAFLHSLRPKRLQT